MPDFLLSAFSDESAPDLEGQIDALHRCGLKYMELRNIDGNSPVQLDISKLKEISKKLKDQDIKVSAVGSPIGKILITQPFEPHFEQFKRAIQAADILGSKLIRIFSFYIPPNQPPEKYCGEVLERLEKLIEYAGSCGITCCHENEKGIFGDSIPRCMLLLEKLDALTGIIDPANFIQCGQLPLNIPSSMLPRIKYLHIKDALPDGTVVPSGQGAGHIPQLLDAFYKKDEAQFLSVEPHLHAFIGVSSLQKEELKHLKAYYSPQEAFDAAVAALKNILNERGYSYE